MLNLVKLAHQMQGMGQHLSQEAEAAQRRLSLAVSLSTKALADQSALVSVLGTQGDRLAFTAAEPIEPLIPHQALPPAHQPHSVIATDGSQIAPSHHEIAYCYLINVGQVVLHYGQSRFPRLDSLPEVVYRPEELALPRQWGMATAEWMGHRRTVAEAQQLATLATATLQELGASPPPLLAMVDGSLIYWFLDNLPESARELILPPILAAWDQLRQQGIPLVGYVSAARSSEGLNFLRLAACPFPTPDCQHHCRGQAEGAACGRFMPLRDANFWASQLTPGQRSPFYRSTAAILERYGDQPIYFCYLHVGTEVARVEVPRWVVADVDQGERALAMVLAQVQKGYGYPVALAEAHNQAVVRGGDRHRFFALLERELIRAGLKNVGVSAKEARKRGSIA
jgi:hypothetical protein